MMDELRLVVTPLLLEPLTAKLAGQAILHQTINLEPLLAIALRSVKR